MRVDFNGEKLIGAKDLEEFLRKTMELPSQQIKFIKNNFHLETEKLKLICFLKSDEEICRLNLVFTLENISLNDVGSSSVDVFVVWGFQKTFLFEAFQRINKQLGSFENFLNSLNKIEGSQYLAFDKVFFNF